MSSKVLTAICLLALLFCGAAAAQAFDPAEIHLFEALARQPNALARYLYLERKMPHLSASERIVAMQLFASAESELGLYSQAVYAFPIKLIPPANVDLPTTQDWQAIDAVNAIVKRAANRHIVMINEAHHDAQTRVLMLALLPRLRALGFNYFAAEALIDTDPGLQKRGYPIRSSGTEYLHEPIYGEIVREAIRLGFKIVPYDVSGSVPEQARETGQADNLYRKVFARDPHARLVVQAGYAHIDKAVGRLGNITPMAMLLQALSGYVPLSIDQTQFLETGLNPSDDYHRLVARFKPKVPVILVNRGDGHLWSASPKLYDANVILPPALSLKAFGNRQIINGRAYKNVTDPSHMSSNSFIELNVMERPSWLTLQGTRHAFHVSAAMCRRHLPCMIEAQYANESEDAVAADRYAFFDDDAITNLYLYPGRYRLRAMDVGGATLSERTITIDASP